MAARQRQPKKDLKPHDQKKHKVDILVLTMTNGNLSVQRACPCTYKEEGRRKHDVNFDYVVVNIVLTKEMMQYISSLSYLSHYLGMCLELPDVDGLESRLPKKREQAQLNVRSCSCDREPLPNGTTSEIRAKEDWYSVVRCMEKDMVQRLHDVSDCGDYDSFCLSVKSRSTDDGQCKCEMKLSASKKESGSKQTGYVRNGRAREPKSKEANEQKVKTSSKSNINMDHSAKIIFRVSESRTPNETGVEKELKPAVESDSTKKVDATEKSNAENKAKAFKKSEAKLNLKTTAESDARKTPKTAQKCDAILESKATEKSDSQHKVKASEESDSRNRVKATEKSDAKQKSKAAEVSESKTEAKTNEASVSRERDKATLQSDTKMEVEDPEVSNSRKKVEAAKKSDFRKDSKTTEQACAKQVSKATKRSSITWKEAAVALDKSEVEKGANNQDEELSRPVSKNARTCMTCGLQEPTPKVYKKCKRCKDEGCLDPPYYCGRDCQVLDWTTRHREEHEKSCAGDPPTS